MLVSNKDVTVITLDELISEKGQVQTWMTTDGDMVQLNKKLDNPFQGRHYMVKYRGIQVSKFKYAMEVL